MDFVARRTGAKRLTDGQCDELANPQRCGERKRCRLPASDGMKIEWHANADHAYSFGVVSRSRLPKKRTVQTMSLFANVPAHALADALEKHLATMDDADVASVVRGGLVDMPPPALAALVASIFDAFRDRGESSDDAAEGAEADIERLQRGDAVSIDALVLYAGTNTGLLKESLARYAHEYPQDVAALPGTLVDAITQRL